MHLPPNRAIPCLGIYPRDRKNIYPHKGLQTKFTDMLLITIKSRKRLKFPTSCCCRINIIWFIHALECCSAIEKNRLPIHAAMWLNLESVKPSERRPTRKATYFMIQVYDSLEKAKLQKQEVYQWLPGPRGGRREFMKQRAKGKFGG